MKARVTHRRGGAAWRIGLACLGAAAAWPAGAASVAAPRPAAAVSVLPAEPVGAADAARGAALFYGARPLPGRIASHLGGLPPAVLRCANCHAVGAGPAVARSIAPRLGRASLALPQARRGGPPSAYDAAALCRLLRTGEDPARVLVDEQMPRYEATLADCAALWGFLSAADHGG